METSGYLTRVTHRLSVTAKGIACWGGWIGGKAVSRKALGILATPHTKNRLPLVIKNLFGVNTLFQLQECVPHGK